MCYNHYMSDYGKAVEVALAAHEGQTDKIGVPYFHHVRAVSELVQKMPSYASFTDEDKLNSIIAGLLHDVVEDSDITIIDLENLGFNKQVVFAVKLLTFVERSDRIAYYEAIMSDPVARLVKTGDLAHNNLYSRRVGLPQEHQDRLAKKYEKAIEIIVLPEDYEVFVSVINKTD